MFQKLEDWLLNKFAGKLLARAAVSVAAWVASTQVQALLAKAGIHGVNVDPAELTAGGIVAAHGAFEWFKKWRLDKAASKVAPDAPKAQ
jgi:hypothetical protein